MQGMLRQRWGDAGAATGTVESRSIVDPVRKYVSSKVRGLVNLGACKASCTMLGAVKALEWRRQDAMAWRACGLGLARGSWRITHP